jgi:hypothetical protein
LKKRVKDEDPCMVPRTRLLCVMRDAARALHAAHCPHTRSVEPRLPLHGERALLLQNHTIVYSLRVATDINCHHAPLRYAYSNLRPKSPASPDLDGYQGTKNKTSTPRDPQKGPETHDMFLEGRQVQYRGWGKRKRIHVPGGGLFFGCNAGRRG